MTKLKVVLLSITLSLLFSTICVKAAAEVTKSTNNNNSANAATTKTKIDILNSAICKKCVCDGNTKLLDCSNKNLTNFFSAEEWQLLQNGDVIFETIRLEHNALTKVPQLPDYPVKNLYLNFNKITDIANSAFRNLTQLTKLGLSHNKLVSKKLTPNVFRGQYSPDTFLPLANLRELDLGYNDLHNLDQDLFEHVPKLEELVLCKNVFRVIDQLTEISISGLTSLKTLDLSYMELKELPSKMLHSVRSLENLILTGNLLESIPEGLDLAINLKRLVLDENPFERFTSKNVFPAMQSLEYLSICNIMDLEEFGSGSFSNLQNLTVLVASDNPKLSKIDIDAFARATKNPLIFDFPPLKELYLHNNNLSHFSQDLLVRWDKINTIDLRFNPWHCDCENSWLIHTLMTQINATTPLLAQNVDCQSPTAWSKVPLMDLNSKHKQLICDNGAHPENDSLILVGLFVGMLAGVPLTIAAMVLYRRGCFGLLHRGVSNTALYNRANFSDDFHI